MKSDILVYMKRLTLLPLLIVLSLVSCTQEPSKPRPQPRPPYDARLRDGSVIFWRGGLLVGPILRHTNSDLTHAAIVLYQDKQPWVYEAVPPSVHRIPLHEYRHLMEEKIHKSRRPMTWFVMQPHERYTTVQLTAMKQHAESQLGRPYMLRGWWKEHEVRGIFCSQYVGDIVEQSGKIASAHWHESPGSLHHKLSAFYEAP